MGTISTDDVRRVLESTNIVEVVGTYVQLRRGGRDFKACCPFHQEKTPSFSVSPARQSYKCFGCGEGGDAISFVRKMENLTFAEAVKRLAQQAGIVVVEEELSQEDKQKLRKRDALIDANTKMAHFFHKMLLANKTAGHARAYINERGYDSTMTKNWQVGWAPSDPRLMFEYANKCGIGVDVLVEAGLAGDNRYARFNDRLMFPIMNTNGECVGFSGRLLAERAKEGKYVNTPETPIFRKSDIIFALDKARSQIGKEKKVLVCEGQLDVIACHESGIKYAVAPLGTAFTAEHARLLKRYTTEVVLCFDADKAGIAAADKAFVQLAPYDFNVGVVMLEGGTDPDEFIKANGVAAFESMILGAKPFFESKVHRAKAAGRLQNASTRASFLQEVVDLLVLMGNSVNRDLALSDVATRMQVGIDELRAELQRVIKKNVDNLQRAKDFKSPDSGVQESENESAPAEVRAMRLHPSIQILCQFALQDPKALEYIVECIDALHNPMSILEGGGVLRSILEDSPDAGNPASINVFIDNQPLDAKKALMQLDLEPRTIKNLQVSIRSECDKIARACIQLRLQHMQSEIASADTPIERKLELQRLCADLKNLLRT